MARRRAHKNSHHGCERCRRRRIKCDESGPPCSNCRARGASCNSTDTRFRPSFLCKTNEDKSPLPASEDRGPEANINQYNGTSCEVSQMPVLEMSERSRELRLMHHWCLKTCFSFTNDLGSIFQEYVVYQALSHDFLLDSMLALTSLHLASETKDNERALNLEEALRYQSKALPSFRAELESISASNCNALFACSVIMMACAAVSSSYGRDDGLEQKAKPGTIPSDLVSVFHFVKGIHSIIDKARPLLENGPFKFVILPNTTSGWTLFQARQGGIPFELRILCRDVHPELHNTYERAILLLEYCSEKDPGMIIPWLIIVGEQFIKQVHNADPPALLIYMCWGALLGRLEEMWWAGAAGKKIVEGLTTCIPLDDKDCRNVVNWAKQNVGLHGQ